MFRFAEFHRTVTAACLGVWAVLSVVFVVTAPPLDAPATADGPAFAAAVSAHAFLWSQGALIVGVLGVAHLLRRRTPVVVAVAAACTTVGAIGHAAFAGIEFVRGSGGAGAADAVQAAVDGSAGIVALVALTGTAVGILTLAIALFRAKQGQAWVAALLVAWLIVEFGLSGMGLWAMLLSAATLVAAGGGLAAMVARSDVRFWATAHEVGAPRAHEEDDSRGGARARSPRL
ncbi:hypothetical protein [Ruicaihuangia caeni]|uniref:hypothetical protein n=1 Tax=Ruicaihuangia caeni TaxID=3042517 RepID=UPI00338FF850